jgi:manganese-dependent inorganic pyrophosphatase
VKTAKTIVVGHKNPDTDSIVSAIAYADLLSRQGTEDVIAACQGDIWRETRYILDRFSVPAPVVMEDVRPHATDVMNRQPIVGRPEESAYAIGRRLRDSGVRALPLVDGEGRLAGLTGVEDFAHILLGGLDYLLLDQIHLELQNIVDTLGGRLLVRATDRRLRDKVMVAAMDIETIRRRIEPDSMMVMGDREDAQRAAIEGGIGALVITGGLPVSDAVVQLASKRNVTLISSPHHTFTTVRLLTLAIPISHVMRTDVLTAAPDEPLVELRDKLSQQRTIPVLDADRRVVGVVSRSDLLNPVRHGVYLVDHNERSQTVDGLEEAELLGIIDHHRIADIQTSSPILFRNEIVGSTSTIVAEMYEESAVPIPPSMAGILLGGLVTDTVLFRSPTSTVRDQRVAHRLAAIASLDITAFGHEIFAVASDLAGRAPRDIVTTDFKEFRIDDHLFAIGYMETVHKRQVEEMRKELIEEMRLLRAERGYASLLLMVVDVIHGETEILIAGMEEAAAEALGQSLASPHSVVMAGVMSRKKQVVPILPRLVHVAKARAQTAR